MKKQQLFEELKNPNNVRFEKLCKVAEVFGFTFRGGRGSHRIYVREGVEELMNFQNVNGKALILSMALEPLSQRALSWAILYSSADSNKEFESLPLPIHSCRILSGTEEG